MVFANITGVDVSKAVKHPNGYECVKQEVFFPNLRVFANFLELVKDEVQKDNALFSKVQTVQSSLLDSDIARTGDGLFNYVKVSYKGTGKSIHTVEIGKGEHKCSCLSFTQGNGYLIVVRGVDENGIAITDSFTVCKHELALMVGSVSLAKAEAEKEAQVTGSVEEELDLGEFEVKEEVQEEVAKQQEEAIQNPNTRLGRYLSVMKEFFKIAGDEGNHSFFQQLVKNAFNPFSLYLWVVYGLPGSGKSYLINRAAQIYEKVFANFGRDFKYFKLNADPAMEISDMTKSVEATTEANGQVSAIVVMKPCLAALWHASVEKAQKQAAKKGGTVEENLGFSLFHMDEFRRAPAILLQFFMNFSTVNHTYTDTDGSLKTVPCIVIDTGVAKGEVDEDGKHTTEILHIPVDAIAMICSGNNDMNNSANTLEDAFISRVSGVYYMEVSQEHFTKTLMQQSEQWGIPTQLADVLVTKLWNASEALKQVRRDGTILSSPAGLREPSNILSIIAQKLLVGDISPTKAEVLGVAHDAFLNLMQLRCNENTDGQPDTQQLEAVKNALSGMLRAN